METIDSLANGINKWDGGVVLVSHDFRLIGQVAEEIWECRDQGVHRWPKDIIAFKEYFREKYAPKDGEALATENAGKGISEDGKAPAIKKQEKPKKAAKKPAPAKAKENKEESLAHLTPEARAMAKQLASYGESVETIVADAVVKEDAAAAALATKSSWDDE
eukprot:COSAG01_NODE_38780_length_485_cov_0.943005_1_plen_161_part_11